MPPFLLLILNYNPDACIHEDNSEATGAENEQKIWICSGKVELEILNFGGRKLKKRCVVFL